MNGGRPVVCCLIAYVVLAFWLTLKGRGNISTRASNELLNGYPTAIHEPHVRMHCVDEHGVLDGR
jgi:hypothetical protein